MKNRRQNDTVVSQFCDAVGRDRLSEVRQEDIHYYVSVLARVPKIYNRSTKDRRLSLPELLERAEDLPDDQVGLAENTVNRNITILGNFLKFARGRGSRPSEELFLSDLRKKVSEDERSARMAFTDEDVEQLARHPIWVGCQSPSRRNAPGNHLIKDGLYWAPILAEATGVRREEIVALAVDDVVLNDAIPHILIRPNTNRRLKNRSSKRAIPIHSRLIELGFLNYVREIIAKGEADLFPELRPDSPTETFGNVFYKPWKTALDQQLSESAERKTFHSFRHRVITRLRHNPSIDKAWVKDLVGHRHEDETDGRYRDPTPLAQLQEAVEAIPVTF